MGARCEPVGRPVLRVLLVDNSEADELEDTPQAPSRPKPRPAFKGAAVNQPSTSTSTSNAAGGPPLLTAPATSSSVPAASTSLFIEPQPAFIATKAEEAQETKLGATLDANPSAFPARYGQPAPPMAHPLVVTATKAEEVGVSHPDLPAFLPLYGQPAPPIAHHGPPPHGFQYNHFAGYGYPHLQGMGPQQHFAGAPVQPVQGAYGGAYQTHPSYPLYHPQGFYPQTFLPPPQADTNTEHQGGTSGSRSTPHE